MIVDAVARRMERGCAVDEAAALPGLFVAWCVNMGLIDPALAEREARAVLRLKYREITGGEFLVAACGGRLDDKALTPAGLAFARAHYEDFERAASERLDGPLEDGWRHYDCLAPWLMERYMGRPPKRPRLAWRPFSLAKRWRWPWRR